MTNVSPCIINSISLYNEDCSRTLKRIPDGSIDLVLQDTPFGCTQNSWDIKPDLAKMWPEWLRVAKPNAAFLFFATQPFASELIISNPKMFRYDLIWYKALGSGFLNANKMPMRNHEHIIVFYAAIPTFNPQKYIGKMRDKSRKSESAGQSPNYGAYKPQTSRNNEYFPQSVLDFTNGDRTSESDHPTQKPIDLIRYLVRTYSNEGETVFDGYTGSGTTPAACIKEKRRFVGSEMESPYFIKSVKRISELGNILELDLK